MERKEQLLIDLKELKKAINKITDDVDNSVKMLDFKNIKTDNPAFWNDLIEYGIVLDGLDYFFKEVYKNE